MHPAITRIRSALKQEIFTSGICKVPVEYCDLYYPSSSSETFHRLNLTTATEKQLANLVETDSVLRRRIRAEPYKLNIYDHGAFFKAHQDTPRAGNMFGSLVVIFPTPHEGGTLVLSTETEQWSFDAHTMLAASAPHIAYVAFYSDITHEVLPVTSGCRITLTYNLFLEDIIDTSGVAWPASDRYDVVRNALKELVDDESAFPAEGILGFGLMHQYSINRYDEDNGTSYDLSELPKF